MMGEKIILQEWLCLQMLIPSWLWIIWVNSVLRLLRAQDPDKKLFDKNKVICISDHLVQPPTEQWATMLNEWREIVRDYDIPCFYESR